LTSLDIIAHELTHGVTSYSAKLIYSNESGALNESFSDIFGTAVNFYARPDSARWDMGHDIGHVFRSLINPKSCGHPDTYLGNYWYSGAGDNGGVHKTAVFRIIGSICFQKEEAAPTIKAINLQ